MKLRFADRMYNSISLEKTASYYKWRLWHEIGKPDIYVILSDEETGRPEAMHARCLFQPWYRTHTPLVLGLAKSYEEAMAVMIAWAYMKYLPQPGDGQEESGMVMSR